jgi:hypothetical protein
MSISNIERMVDAIVRDEMNFLQSMSLEDYDLYVENLVRAIVEQKSNAEIIAEYERLGD